MKKNMKIVFCLMLVMAISCLTGCSWYDADYLDVENGHFYIGFNRKDAFIRNFAWNGDTDHMKIVLPDEFKSVRVTKLGGYTGRGFPSPFRITLPEKYCNESMATDPPEDTQEWYPNGYNVVELAFTVTLNVSLEELFYGGSSDYYQFKHDNGKYTLYHPTYYYECPEDNKTFYTKDGVIYLKATDEKAEWTELG